MHMVFARICQNSIDFEATFFTKIELSKEFGTAFYIENYRWFWRSYSANPQNARAVSHPPGCLWLVYSTIITLYPFSYQPQSRHRLWRGSRGEDSPEMHGFLLVRHSPEICPFNTTNNIWTWTSNMELYVYIYIMFIHNYQFFILLVYIYIYT